MFRAGEQCYARNDAPGVIHPGLWICPVDMRHSVMSFEYVGFNTGSYPDDIIQLSVERTHDTTLEPAIWNSKNRDFNDHHRINMEAFVSHKVKWLHNPPPDQIDVIMRDANKGDWYRMSYCVGEMTNPRVKVTRESVDQAGKRYRFSPEEMNNEMAKEVNNFDELHGEEEAALSYFIQDGWVHARFNQLESRTDGGVYNLNGTMYTINPSKEIAHGHGSLFRFNIAAGSIGIKIELDIDDDLTEQIDCVDFTEPICKY